MSIDGTYFERYIQSDYKIDHSYQGYFALSSEANWGRVVSLIDITSQVGKALLGTSGICLVSVYNLLSVVGYTLVMSAHFLVCNSEKGREYRQLVIKKGIDGLCIIGIGIALVPIWRTFMVCADSIGIFLPEVGRGVRRNVF